MTGVDNCHFFYKHNIAATTNASEPGCDMQIFMFLIKKCTLFLSMIKKVCSDKKFFLSKIIVDFEVGSCRFYSCRLSGR